MYFSHIATLGRLRRIFGQHPLTKNHVFRAFLRFIVFQASCRYLRSSMVVDWLGGVKLIIGPGMTGVTGELYTGLLEFDDSLFTLHLLRPGELYIDVGANAGTYSLLAAKLAKCRVIAIEPGEAAAQMLRTNLALNGVLNQVEVIEVGASNKQDTLRFTTHKDALNRITTDQSDNTTTIPVETLDNILVDKQPVLIKIDVEGHEKCTIEGAKHVFASPKLLAVQMETGEAAIENNVLEMMTAKGFIPCVYSPHSRELKVTNILSRHNTLFVKDLEAVRSRLKSASAVNVYGKSY